ncbi:TRAP transporter small permease [Prosthecomicrobium sp. N25]|uniref:TRAP transporter small permease n=1 Tax=Prosthecomicrobium sp. N25 TaxID=3129254 RepID=UPI0030783A34
MRPITRWLRARADDVAVALLALMFTSFLVQIISRYVFNDPLGWTLEACLTTWLWLVFWGSAFVLDDRDHIKFDVLYVSVSSGMRRAFSIASATAIVFAMAASFPATWDYITFYKIKSSAIIGIRLDIVFGIYAVFAIAIIVRYGVRAWRLIRGARMEDLDGEPRS